MDRAKMELGRRMLISGPRVAQMVEALHRWVPKASGAAEGAQVTPVMQNNRLVAVESTLGRFDVAQEFARCGEQLFARIIFLETPTALRKEPREIYSIRVFEETAHFGRGPELDHFEWDHDRNQWSARNWLRLSYEVAVAATEPRA